MFHMYTMSSTPPHRDTMQGAEKTFATVQIHIIKEEKCDQVIIK